MMEADNIAVFHNIDQYDLPAAIAKHISDEKTINALIFTNDQEYSAPSEKKERLTTTRYTTQVRPCNYDKQYKKYNCLSYFNCVH